MHFSIRDWRCERTGIDPTSIFPEFKLGADLGMKSLDIQLFVADLAKELRLEIGFEPCRCDDATVRQVAEALRRWMNEYSRAA